MPIGKNFDADSRHLFCSVARAGTEIQSVVDFQGEGFLILVIVGSGVFPFTRLLKEIDRIAPLIPETFVVQAGEGPFTPVNCTTFRFVSYGELVQLYRDCSIVIAHTSGGPLIYSRRFEKPIITIPRKKNLGEAVADHQGETAQALRAVAEPMRIILDEVEEISYAIPTALTLAREGCRYTPRPETTSLIEAIRDACIGVPNHLQDRNA